MATQKKPELQLISGRILEWINGVLEGLQPGRFWRKGGVIRWVGTPLALAIGLAFCLYIVPVGIALTAVIFWIEGAFLGPKTWLKFNLAAGFAVLAIFCLFTGIQGWIAAGICLWISKGIFETIK